MIDPLIKMNSQFYGEYFCKRVKGFFEEGQLIKIYSHFSLRLYAVGKNDEIFKVHYTDFGTTFFTKDEWRNKKINSILKK